MRLGRRIGVITPALNEEDAIARVIADIPAWVDHIVVVDNGSVDDTADNAAEAGQPCSWSMSGVTVQHVFEA